MLVAFSGGVDSAVLAHHLHQKNRLDGIVHYVYSDPEVQFVNEAKQLAIQTAEQYGVPLHINCREITVRSNNCENKWREQRYLFFNEVYQSTKQTIAVAHHMDDQLASYLLSLVKQSDRCFIPIDTKIKGTPIHRPFLKMQWWKETIRYYQKEHNVAYVEDPMNYRGDRYHAEKAIEQLRCITQFMPLFTKKYKQYLQKQ